MDTKTSDLIKGDVTGLRQILVNLLSNRIKFTNYGEVVFSATSKVTNQLNNSFITQEIPQLYEIKFTVKDTGIGIHEDRMYRLLQAFLFSQVDGSTTRHYGGTGLGLVISQRLTELMGGKIWLESKVAQGSSFIFTIITSFIEKSDIEDINDNYRLITKKELLIVDDNIINRQSPMLQSQSFGMLIIAV